MSDTVRITVEEADRIDQKIARLRGELSRAVVREGEARNALMMLLSFHESVGSPSPAAPCEIARGLLATPSPLSDAAQEVLEAARTARHVPGKEWADRAFMCAIGKLWDKVDEYDALLEGRDRKEG